MTRLMRFPSVFLLALGALMLASVAQARPGGRGHHRGGPGGKMLSPKHFERLADDLGLEEGVRNAIKAQLEATRAEAKAKKQALHAEHEALRGLLEADPPNRAAVMAQIDKIGALRLAMHKLRVGAMIDLQAALTPEQRAKLKAKMEARRAKRHKRRGKRRKHRRGGDEPGFEAPDDE